MGAADEGIGRSIYVKNSGESEVAFDGTPLALNERTDYTKTERRGCQVIPNRAETKVSRLRKNYITLT